MSTDLEILVPDGAVVQTHAVSVRAADSTGRFGLLPNHEPFVTLLVPCILEYQDDEGRARYVAVDGGVLLMQENRISIVTREAVVAERIEQVADAAQAMLQARRTAEKGARSEFAELQASLVRELRSVERRS